LFFLQDNKKYGKKERMQMVKIKSSILRIFPALCVVSILSVLFAVQCASKQQSEGKDQLQKNTSQTKTDVEKSTIVSEEKPNIDKGVKVTFIELGSVNCIPCRMMQPVMKEIREKYSEQVKVVFHDVWTAEGRPFGAEFGIQAIPTQVFLDKDGKEYYRHTGFFPENELVKILQMKGVN
jgi:thioredoxin 1